MPGEWEKEDLTEKMALLWVVGLWRRMRSPPERGREKNIPGSFLKRLRGKNMNGVFSMMAVNGMYQQSSEITSERSDREVHKGLEHHGKGLVSISCR